MEMLTELGQSLFKQLGQGLPTALGAVLVLIIGLWVAKMLKKAVSFAVSKMGIDQQLSGKMPAGIKISSILATLVYFVLVLFVLLTVLGMMGLTGVMLPIQNMLNQFLGFLPNIIGAGIIGFVGYLLATIISGLAGAAASGLDEVAKKANLGASLNLSKLVKQLVFAFIFIPILIVALDALKMEAISVPASAMLGTILAVIPNLLAAAIIVAIFYFGGKFVVGLLVGLLESMGINQLAQEIGILKALVRGGSMAKLVGNVVFFFILFLGIVTAAEKLQFVALTAILTMIMALAGKISLGFVILAVGSFIADLVSGSLLGSAKNAWLSSILHFVILGVFVSIALNTMDLGREIVNIAFTLFVGAGTVAFALAFGLGGRETAGKLLADWVESIRRKS